MAVATDWNKKLRELEARLWASADALRSNSKLDAADYCMPVMGLIFLRYAWGRLHRVTEELEQENEELTKSAEALDWFWQINEAYVRGRYTQARTLIEDMGEELPEYLPKESITDNDRFSPYDRYQEIYEALY